MNYSSGCWTYIYNQILRGLTIACEAEVLAPNICLSERRREEEYIINACQGMCLRATAHVQFVSALKELRLNVIPMCTMIFLAGGPTEVGVFLAASGVDGVYLRQWVQGRLHRGCAAVRGLTEAVGSSVGGNKTNSVLFLVTGFVVFVDGGAASSSAS